MKKKILSTLMATAAIATMGVATAQAGNLDSVVGAIKIDFTGFDAAQVGYDTSGIADGAFLCATAAACDAASGAVAAPGANGTDDTWGFSRVSQIASEVFPFGPQYQDGDDGDVLLAYFHGFQDIAVRRLDADNTEFFSAGGEVDIYRIDAATFAALDVIPGDDQSALEASIALFAPGSLYLSLAFQAGECDPISAPNATLCSNFDTSEVPFAAAGVIAGGVGSSSGTAIAVGGSAMNKFPNDFIFTQVTASCVGFDAGGAAIANPACAGVSSNFNLFIRPGSATTVAIPAPGALGLLGLGLVGLGLAGRRRKA